MDILLGLHHDTSSNRWQELADNDYLKLLDLILIKF